MCLVGDCVCGSLDGRLLEVIVSRCDRGLVE